MKMKKLLLLVSLLFGMSLKTWAAVGAPRDSIGFPLDTIDWVGAIPCNIGTSTGTNSVLCGSGRIVVYGVIASSVPTTDFLVMRDTATANQTSSTATIVFANGTGASATGVATQTFKFPVPMKFSNGLSINAIPAPTSPNGPGWTVLYRPLAATE